MSNNPEFKAYGSKRMRWIEKDDAGELRDANDYLKGSYAYCATGYYCDDYGDAVAVPAVYIVEASSADVSSNEYYAAVRDPQNDGCAAVDFEQSYSDPEEAAQAAHGLAERYADAEREYQAKESARMEAEESIPDELRYLRRAHSKALSIDDASGARMREEYRDRAATCVKQIRELRGQFNNFKE